MILVILTETALFTIFVVAYLYYIGKSVSGPYPHEVLELPILGTVMLLSSSVTIVIAEQNLHKGITSLFNLWWVITALLGIGFHLTFDPQHFAGILGMPRRIYTYQPGRGWDIWNLLSTIGAFLQAAGAIYLVVNLLWSGRKGKIAGDDPWDAWTLEWATTSPPPDYNFETLPEVRSRRPLWDLKHPEDPDWKFE